MDIVKKSIKEAIERLQNVEFYEPWTDSKVSEILEKLKGIEKDIENLQNTIRNARTMPSLKDTAVLGNYDMFPVTGSTDPEITGRVWEWDGKITPDYRDQWRYETNGTKLHREVLKMSDRTETNGDLIAKEWTKFMETASNEDRVKVLTEIIRTLTPETSV
jgi:hypothetical protein